MATLRRALPSLNALTVFEAAGRLASFSRAARELGISQAAVSYAVARLEEQLGCPLFQRHHRRVRLTDAGQRFHADVAIGLLHIQRSAAALRAGAASHVTLACSTAFAAYWMVPRMAALRAELPGIDLRIQTAERDLDLAAEGIPLGIRGGRAADWPELDSTELARELIYPVCSAGYLAQTARPASAEDLLTHPLIHLDEPFRTAASWAEWFAAAGIGRNRVPGGLQINDYVLVIQAVLEGQGVALGWHHLVHDLVARGVLVRVGDRALDTGRGFHITWPRGEPLPLAAQRVRDWLRG